MKKAAKEMLSAAEELAVAIRQRTGLPTTARLDDRLLDSSIIVSGNPRFGNPGRWFDYLKDPKAVEALRMTGIRVRPRDSTGAATSSCSEESCPT